MRIPWLSFALAGLLWCGAAPPARACLWDSDTLWQERLTNPQLAGAIFNAPPQPDVGRLRARIERLRGAPREADPAWWNDLAGAHLRLGELQTAVELLEPAAQRFPNDYGVHANLGTAYHLLKRYPEAEREIARDLELNPNAHFGLERYHLALLQYLVRAPVYQAQHVYVDEWTEAFHDTVIPFRRRRPHGKLPPAATNDYDGGSSTDFAREMAGSRDKLTIARARGSEHLRRYEQRMVALRAQGDRPPPYRYRWDLAGDPKFREGVVYMASLNRQEPACWVMLGVASLEHQDLNLAAAAFQRAVDLGSPQSERLRGLISEIRDHQTKAGPWWGRIEFLFTATVGVLVFVLLFRIGRGIPRGRSSAHCVRSSRAVHYE